MLIMSTVLWFTYFSLFSSSYRYSSQINFSTISILRILVQKTVKHYTLENSIVHYHTPYYTISPCLCMNLVHIIINMHTWIHEYQRKMVQHLSAIILNLIKLNLVGRKATHDSSRSVWNKSPCLDYDFWKTTFRRQEVVYKMSHNYLSEWGLSTLLNGGILNSWLLFLLGLHVRPVRPRVRADITDMALKPFRVLLKLR